MSTYTSYDDVFQDVLTAYGNAAPDHQIVVGDLLYVRAAGLASAMWGLYREADWVERQIWPDTADPDSVIHHAGQIGLSQQSGEDVAGLLARFLARLRTPAAGGNAIDIQNWAMAVPSGSEAIASVKCYPAGYGPGTRVIVVKKVDGTPASDALLAAIKADSLVRGPVAPAAVYVLNPATFPIDISITMVGGSSDLARTLISSWMASLESSQSVNPLVFQAFGYQAGATIVTVNSPTVVTTPTQWGLVTVNSLLVNGV
jgi:uncharacterized phage protein gp47/JayE